MLILQNKINITRNIAKGYTRSYKVTNRGSCSVSISMLSVAADALFGPSEAIICLQNDPETGDRTRCRETLVKAVRKGIESYPKACYFGSKLCLSRNVE